MSDKILVGTYNSVPGACGIDAACNFELAEKVTKYKDYWSGKMVEYKRYPLVGEKPQGGSDWLISGFNKSKVCEQAYKELSEKYPIVYQSPVRNNRNMGSRHPFFFAIFDTKKEPTPKIKKEEVCAAAPATEI